MVDLATIRSSGANLPRLAPSELAAFQVPLPPIEEQHRIAAVLDQADAARARRRESLDVLDSLADSIFLAMFGDPARNSYEWPIASISSLADGPDGIKCGPFGTQLGKDEYHESGVPLWGIRQVNRGFSITTDEFLTPAKAAELSTYSLVGGDVVMTRKGTVGNCAVYPRSFEPGVMHSDLLRIRLAASANPEFLATQMRLSTDIKGQIGLMSGGAIMAGINVTKLKTMRVLVPPVDLQREFAIRLDSVTRQQSGAKRSAERLDELFASLQHRAFRGEL